MIIFADSVDLKELANLAEQGLIDGVTTNPSLIAQNTVYSFNNFKPLIKEICQIVQGPVSVEVSEKDYIGMINEGNSILNIADNIVLKLPVTVDGIKACSYFTKQKKQVNMTLCFSISQALLAAKAGATYISPFIGRLEDNGDNGLKLISDVKIMYDKYPHFRTKVLASSIRHLYHFTAVAKIGVDAITLAPKIIKTLLEHPLTLTGLNRFEEDWSKWQKS